MSFKKVCLFISKTLFCFKINKSFFSAFLFIKKSKQYTSKYKKNIFVGNDNREVIRYDLNLKRKELPVYIRTYSGDFDIFYEIFWKKNYHIPKKLSLKNYEVIVDLGANIGLTSVYYALEYPDAKIYSLEAEEENYNLLVQNCCFSDNIHVMHGAVVTEDKIVSLSFSDLSYNFKIADKAQSNAQEVQGYNMHSLMNLFGIVRIDLLKIDIEGMEKFILKQNNEWLNQVKNIIIELHKPYEIENLRRDLSPFGFKIISPKNSNHLKMIFATKD